MQWLIIPLIAVIPVSEALSVVIQIVYFRLTTRCSRRGLLHSRGCCSIFTASTVRHAGV